jgi:hypothetical protein
MAEIQIWNGSSNFNSGSTPFGFYDTDITFKADADKVARFCATRLGYPLMDVELQSGSFYACFEEAVTTYGNEVFQYKVRENYLSLEGISKAIPVNGKVIEPSLQRIVEIANTYGTEAEVGGNITKHTGSLYLSQSVQEYDLNDWAVKEGITGSIEVRKVYYEAPPAIQRYFDPYVGTGTGVQSLMDAFDFGSMSPGINFMMMPVSYDVALLQGIEFNDQIRRSHYSFELTNNRLKIFPLPKEDRKLRFDYYKIDDKRAGVLRESNDPAGTVTNVGEVPYENPTYADINSIGREWIFRYTLALSKEVLAYVRGKYTTVPVPGSEATLNQQDLLTDARIEKERLLTELRDMLDQTSRQSQLERKANEGDSMKKIQGDVPMVIYVG